MYNTEKAVRHHVTPLFMCLYIPIKRQCGWAILQGQGESSVWYLHLA